MTEDVGTQVELRLNEILEAHPNDKKAIATSLKSSEQMFLMFLDGKAMLVIICKPASGAVAYAKPVKDLLEKFTTT